MSVAFFDLDRTVLDVNSGHLWFRHEWRAGRISPRVALRAMAFFGLYALGRDGLSDALAEASALYAGWVEDDLDTIIGQWFDAEIGHRVRPGALEALEAHRNAGHTTVLATTSSAYVARRAATQLGFDAHVATTLEADEQGILTGRLSQNAYGRGKLDLAERWAHGHQVPLADCTFYTDSFSDLALLERVGSPVVVHPDRRLARHAQKRGWRVVDWGTADGPR